MPEAWGKTYKYSPTRLTSTISPLPSTPAPTMKASKNLGIIFLPVISNLVAVNSLKDEIFHPPGVSGDATPLFPLDAGNTEGYIRMIRSGPGLETVHNKGILRSLRSSPGPHTLAASRARR